MGAVILAGYDPDPLMSLSDDMLHDLICAVLIIHHNRRNLAALCISVCHHCRNRQILWNTTDRPLVSRHIDDSLHLLGDQFPDLIPHHAIEIIPVVVSIIVFLK